jgi:hypothetical protein
MRVSSQQACTTRRPSRSSHRGRIEKGSQGTVLAGVRAQLHKKDGVWLIKDAEVEKAKPGQDF